MAAPKIQEGLKYKIKFQKGPLAGQKFEYDTTLLKIGRGNENDLILVNDLKASRAHAEIVWNGFELQIKNLSKKNFLSVNGKKVEIIGLESGASISIGDSEFSIEFDQEEKTKLLPETPASEPMPGPVQTPVQVAVASVAQFDANEVSVEMKSNPILYQTSAAPVAPSFPRTMVGGAGSAQPNYASNIPGATPGKPRRHKPKKLSTGSNSGRIRFYGIVVVIGIIGWWLMGSDAKKKELTFRSSEQIEQDIEASREEIKEFEARKEKMDNIQYKRAQENYIRGFRDYRQGNYGRARESFQVVLNLDPENELAKRYYHLSKVKFDELVKFHMLQGNRYREKKNWRMCKSSFFNVMTMLGNNNQDPVYKEAKQYRDQCSLAEEGRF